MTTIPYILICHAVLHHKPKHCIPRMTRTKGEFIEVVNFVRNVLRTFFTHEMNVRNGIRIGREPFCKHTRLCFS